MAQLSEIHKKALLTKIIPKWGIPSKISTDNETHFVNEAIKQMGQFLGINMMQHCLYAPWVDGAIERVSGSLKNKLAKCCEKTGLTCVKALPIVLMSMQMKKRTKVNLSPFEILFSEIGAGLEEKELEGAIPGASDELHVCESGREDQVDPCQPLQ